MNKPITKLIALAVIGSFLLNSSLPALYAADPTKDEQNKTIAAGNDKDFKTAQEAVGNEKKVTATAEDATAKPPARPGDDEKDPAVWAKYYNDYLAYIKNLTDTAKKSQAWTDLCKDMLKLAQEHPERITAGAIGNVMAAMTDELKEKYRNPEYKLDLSKAQAALVDASLAFVKSDAFKKLDAGQQNHVTWRFTHLAVELSWRSAFNTANKDLYGKIGQFFKTMLESDSVDVKSFAFNHLMHLYRTDVWGSPEGNKDVANQILNDALKVSGGIKGLLDSFLNRMKITNEKDAELRAQIACSLANIVWHHGALSKEGGYTITDADMNKAVEASTDFIKGVNNGTIEISGGSRNALMHYFGSALIVLMSEGKHQTETNKALANAFITLARDSYLLGEEEGGSTSLQVSVVNVLTALMNTANAVKDTDYAKKCSDVLLDKDFDVDDFIEKARELTKSTTNADWAAYICTALANLAKINLAKDTGKVTDTDVKNIVADIKAWLADPNHLLDMRNMHWQKDLYEAVAALAKQVYEKDAALGKDSALADDLVAIFTTIAGLKDSLVQEFGTTAVEGLVKSLKENGYKDLAYRLEIALCTDSESLMKKAWAYYDAKDMAGARAFADEVIKRYTDEAVKQQASLKDFAPEGKESDYWALNDVATAHFVLGKIYAAQDNTAKAKTEFQTIVNKFGYAQCWDTKGWWWKVKEAAEKELKNL
ncbi:MAG TPA: tetratricopeptide repeat protein [Candidatus Omnitrophota bacterium]|nr:tetratricopeptide repeat protein [Candidatus Omnitrophota bacterium]